MFWFHRSSREWWWYFSLRRFFIDLWPFLPLSIKFILISNGIKCCKLPIRIHFHTFINWIFLNFLIQFLLLLKFHHVCNNTIHISRCRYILGLLFSVSFIFDIMCMILFKVFIISNHKHIISFLIQFSLRPSLIIFPLCFLI